MLTLKTIFDRVVLYLAYLSCALVFAAFAIENAEVILRSTANIAIPWAIEVTEYILVTVVFLAGAWVLREEGHSIIDAALTRFSLRQQGLILAFTSMAGGLLCLFLAWQGVSATVYYFREGIQILEKTLRPLYAPFIMVVPLGFFLLAIQFFINAQKHWKQWQSGVTAEKEIGEKFELG